MSSPNGLQRLQAYNSSLSSRSDASSRNSDRSSRSSSSTPSSPQARSHEDRNSENSSSTPSSTTSTPQPSSADDSSRPTSPTAVPHPHRVDMNEAFVSNIVEHLRANPQYGCYALHEELREVFNKYVAQHSFPYTFDEMNVLLLYNAGGDDTFQQYARVNITSTDYSYKFPATSLSIDEPSSNNTVSTPELSPTQSVHSVRASPIEQQAVEVDCFLPENDDDEVAHNSPAAEQNVGHTCSSDQESIGPSASAHGSQSPTHSDNDPTSPESQTGSGVSISSRLRSHAFSKHLADFEFLPDNECK